jgi:hypothetical protein
MTFKCQTHRGTGQELQAKQRGLAYAGTDGARLEMNPTAHSERHVFTLIESPALAPRHHD